MELHGTRADANIPSELEGVDELREVTFILTAGEMNMLADFFAACAKEAAGEHFGDFEHHHLKDYLWKQRYAGPDLVVYRRRS